MALPEWAGWAGIILGGGGLGGAGAAILKFKPERQKLKAEASVMLAASSMEMATKLSERLDKALTRIDKLEENEDIQREQLHKHSEWDRLVAHQLREKGVDVPSPPPLFVPSPNAA